MRGVVLTKNARRRAKKKEKRAAAAAVPPPSEEKVVADDAAEEKVAVEYVSDELSDADPVALEQFQDVFKRFASAEALTGMTKANEEKREEEEVLTSPEERAAMEQKPEEAVKALSRKKRRELSRISIAELKQIVATPEAVESHDVTAADPKTLVFLKSYRNAVPVPRHWSHKRRYLQGKRGVEKRPWVLPEYIAQTGVERAPAKTAKELRRLFDRAAVYHKRVPFITELSLAGIEKIRKAVEEAEALKKIKQRTRERVQPKMGRLDVDYQVLHDAFFKWQTKPYLSGHGDLYYEGKEFEVQLKHKKPGNLSAALKAALGMPDGAPPPWLINMQRYGPPPSYPNMRIQGLNSPIPEGASFGYHPGGWGKPPVDEYGMPLYGDVFGARAALQPRDTFVPDTVHWGDIVISREDDESSEEEEDEDRDDPAAAAAATTSSTGGGSRPSSARRRPQAEEEDDDASEEYSQSGTETPLSSVNYYENAQIDLRKRSVDGTETPDDYSTSSSVRPPPAPRELYKVIDEERTRGNNSATLFASDKRYRVTTDSGNDEQQVAQTEEEPNLLRKRKLDKPYEAPSRKQKDFKF